MALDSAARLGPGVVASVSLALFASGCAALGSSPGVQGRADLPTRTELSRVPFHPQEAYQCGPAALATVLNWSGDPVSPEQLVPATYTASRQGSLQSDMVSGARRRGYLAYPIATLDALVAELAAGHPVLVLQNLALAWYPVWHYAVVVGYDLPRAELVLRSGSIQREVLSLRLFDLTWARSGRRGLVVLRPGEMPARPDEQTYLQAALGLEQARRWREAETAYSVALLRWPGSLGALMGLGNSRYALNQPARAEAALREATRLHPDAAPAFNNLAMVLAKQGRYREARSAAQRAIDIGGPMSDEYRRTLSEIDQGAR